MPTRRSFLGRSAGAAAAILAVPTSAAADVGSPASRGLLTNQVGYAPTAGKVCLKAGQDVTPFQLVDRATGGTVFDGTMHPHGGGDLGNYVAADFSSFTRPGSYLLRAAGNGTPIDIGPDVYLPAIHACIGYFARQRCGDSKTGYHAPCHLDDGRRSDTGEHRDVTGGWHDACDLRKWTDATIYGMLGLQRALALLPAGQIDRNRVIDELRWGNTYFLKMQEPDGYLMNYCGGDDGNRFTDNQIGSGDDRRIHVEPAELPAQFHFVAAQAAMVRLTRDADAPYAAHCESAARRCLKWCIDKRDPGAASSLAAAVSACAALHRTAPARALADQGAVYVRKLLSLQVTRPPAGLPARGFFLAARDRMEPARDIQNGNLPLLALCDALETFPGHADAAIWRKALELHLQYLREMAARSAFGTVPFGIYYGKDPGGGRRIGESWYRWFMRPGHERADEDWWVGVNAHSASHGIGLCRAAAILADAELARLGQRQLDWILGANPFDASTVTGVGRNQPALFVTREFTPATPLIPGGVMNGIGGTAGDEPTLDPGSYHTCEYWTPMVAYTLWLLAELHRRS